MPQSPLPLSRMSIVFSAKYTLHRARENDLNNRGNSVHQFTQTPSVTWKPQIYFLSCFPFKCISPTLPSYTSVEGTYFSHSMAPACKETAASRAAPKKQ